MWSSLCHNNCNYLAVTLEKCGEVSTGTDVQHGYSAVRGRKLGIRSVRRRDDLGKEVRAVNALNSLDPYLHSVMTKCSLRDYLQRT